MSNDLFTLTPGGLQRFLGLRRPAIEAVTARFVAEHGATLGPRGGDACREDLGYHLEFLQPVLEFGVLEPMVDYLRWLTAVLATRGIPASHVALSLDWLAEFFADAFDSDDGAIVVTALRAAKRGLQAGPAPARAEQVLQPWPECAPFEDALLAGDHSRAAPLFARAVADGRGLIAAELHLIRPAMYGIGEKWQNNEVTVAQEHLATLIAQSVMTVGLAQSNPARSNGRKVLLACVAGNQHAMGLQMVADAFRLSGWETQLLGADVPTEALLAQVAAWKPALVGLSISFPHQLRTAKDAIARLQRALAGARPPVIIGGLAINQFHKLAAHVGADGWSRDSASATVLGAQLADAPA